MRFRRAFIADEMMLADPLGDMVGRIRPGFVLLQTGMGLGVIRASIDAMVQADGSQERTNRYLPRRPPYFEDALAELRAAIMNLAETPRDGSPGYVRAVLEARLRTGDPHAAGDGGGHAAHRRASVHHRIARAATAAGGIFRRNDNAFHSSSQPRTEPDGRKLNFPTTRKCTRCPTRS